MASLSRADRTGESPSPLTADAYRTVEREWRFESLHAEAVTERGKVEDLERRGDKKRAETWLEILTLTVGRDRDLGAMWPAADYPNDGYPLRDPEIPSPAKVAQTLLALTLMVATLLSSVACSMNFEAPLPRAAVLTTVLVSRVVFPSAFSGGARGLLPPHRRILEETGYLDFVEQNLDVVVYYDWSSFRTRDGDPIGMSQLVGGNRVAHVATLNRSEEDITWVIVHEAAHCAGIATSGHFYSEEYARSVARQFTTDLRRRVGR